MNESEEDRKARVTGYINRVIENIFSGDNAPDDAFIIAEPGRVLYAVSCETFMEELTEQFPNLNEDMIQTIVHNMALPIKDKRMADIICLPGVNRERIPNFDVIREAYWDLFGDPEKYGIEKQFLVHTVMHIVTMIEQTQALAAQAEAVNRNPGRSGMILN